jgi:hypothetical protein
MLWSHNVLPGMRERKEGCIINIVWLFLEGADDRLPVLERRRILSVFRIMRQRQL